MDDVRACWSKIINTHGNERKKFQNPFGLTLPTFSIQIPQRLENCIKSHFKKSANDDKTSNSVLQLENKPLTSSAANLDLQLQAWRKNPMWVDEPPEVKVSTPKGSLCNLNVKVKVGLPPDAVYDIVTDPDNRRVFKNIKEVIARRVLVDEGSRQVVEVEQAALWRFLWWSGTIAVHVIVDQNREDYSMKFHQVKTGFMKRFEGSWSVQPLFVDEQICYPVKPKTWADYSHCTGGKGRVASVVTLTQLIEPAIVPPPPISWYLRGITTRTTEMLIQDLLAESARIRGDYSAMGASQDRNLLLGASNRVDIKESWKLRRRNTRLQTYSRRFQER